MAAENAGTAETATWYCVTKTKKLQRTGERNGDGGVVAVATAEMLGLHQCPAVK